MKKFWITTLIILFFNSPWIFLNSGCQNPLNKTLLDSIQHLQSLLNAQNGYDVVHKAILYKDLQNFMLDTLTQSSFHYDGGAILKQKLINALKEISGDTLWMLVGRQHNAAADIPTLFITERSAGNPFPVDIIPMDTTTICKCKVPKPCCPKDTAKMDVYQGN